MENSLVAAQKEGQRKEEKEEERELKAHNEDGDAPEVGEKEDGWLPRELSGAGTFYALSFVWVFWHRNRNAAIS